MEEQFGVSSQPTQKFWQKKILLVFGLAALAASVIAVYFYQFGPERAPTPVALEEPKEAKVENLRTAYGKVISVEESEGYIVVESATTNVDKVWTVYIGEGTVIAFWDDFQREFSEIMADTAGVGDLPSFEEIIADVPRLGVVDINVGDMVYITASGSQDLAKNDNVTAPESVLIFGQ